MVDEIELHFHKKEKKKGFLFGDLESNRKEAKRFMDFLKEYNVPITTLSSGMAAHPVNKAFVALCHYRGLYIDPNGYACYRFLKDDCGLAFAVDEKTYANFIRPQIKNEPNYKIGDMLKLIEKAYKGAGKE